ncbi:MAG: DUF4403 family protein [Bacteroidota bacterium]
MFPARIRSYLRSQPSYKRNFNLDSLPVSEINIPIQISLKPVYAMAEKNVDTLFTSVGYPEGWVQQSCDMRYKYTFRRSPLQMKVSGMAMNPCIYRLL